MNSIGITTNRAGSWVSGPTPLSVGSFFLPITSALSLILLCWSFPVSFLSSFYLFFHTHQPSLQQIKHISHSRGIFANGFSLWTSWLFFLICSVTHYTAIDLIVHHEFYYLSNNSTIMMSSVGEGWTMLHFSPKGKGPQQPMALCYYFHGAWTKSCLCDLDRWTTVINR